MGKIDAILHAYSAIYAAEHRKDQCQASSNKNQLTSSIQHSHTPPPISINSILRDTQRFWLAASAEHRAALEVFAENKYCQGIFPHCRRRSGVVDHPEYYVTTIKERRKENNLSFVPSRETERNNVVGNLPAVSNKSSKDNEKYNYYLSEDPSKRFSLRLPRSISSEIRNQRRRQEEENLNEDEAKDSSDYSLSEEENPSHTRSNRTSSKSARKLRSNPLKIRKTEANLDRTRLSKKMILREYLQPQINAIRALKESKALLLNESTKSINRKRSNTVRKPIMEIDWASIPLPSKTNPILHEQGSSSQYNTEEDEEEAEDVNNITKKEAKSHETGSNLSDSNSKIEASDDETSINLL